MYYEEQYSILMEDICDVIKNFEEYDIEYLKNNCDEGFYAELVNDKIPKKAYICPNSNQYCEVFNTLHMGRGVRSKIHIPKNTKIGCYTGILKRTNQVLSTDEWRYNFQYIFKGFLVDDTNCSSIMSLINHSSEPNVTIFYHLHDINDKEECHIVCVTTKDIEVEEELFIDYGNDYWKYYDKLYLSKNQTFITDFFYKK